MKSKHAKKENHKTIKIIIIIILLLVCGFSAYKIFEYYNPKQESHDSQEILDEIKVTETDGNNENEGKKGSEGVLQVQELKKENSDIVGWIEIEGTDVNYPVLQCADNKYYMTHNYKKEYTADGSLFLDKDYDWNLPSSNLLIYGHNNKNGKMFNKLLDYQEESFYKEHPIIKFTTDTEDAEYEIIAVFESRVYYKHETDVFRYYYFINAENEEEFNDYVDNSKEASLYDTGKTAKYGDQLLTLSTCAYHTEDGRFAVVAKKRI